MTAETVAVTVTEEHIAAGHPCDAARCPVALALLDAFPGALRAEVWFSDEDGEEPSATAWFPGGRIMDLVLPDAAGQFASDVDGGLDVSPFTFTVDVPS